MSNVSTTIQGWLVIIFPIEFLVGGFNSSETYYSMGRIIPYIMKKKCSNPPIKFVSPLIRL